MFSSLSNTKPNTFNHPPFTLENDICACKSAGNTLSPAFNEYIFPFMELSDVETVISYPPPKVSPNALIGDRANWGRL